MILLSDQQRERPDGAYQSVMADRRAWLDGSAHVLDANGPNARPFAPFASEWLCRPIIDLFASAVRAHPAAIAITDGDVALSYTEAWATVQNLARRIAAVTAPGDLVGILLPPGTAFPVAMLACLAAGRPFLPMDLHYPREWIEQVVADARLSAVIGRHDPFAPDDLLPTTVRLIDIGPMRALDVAPADGVVLTPLGPDEPAVVLYTSGSSGRPKGIVNSQRNLLRRVEQYVNAAHIGPQDQFLPLTSDCTISGLRERLSALLSGATLHQIDFQRSSARQITAVLRQRKITIIFAVPALLRSIVKFAEGLAPRSLRVVRVGGEAVLGSDLEMLRGWLPPSCLIELGYGSTEAPIMQWFIPSGFQSGAGKLPIGYPLAGNELAILDDEDRAVAHGEVGELVVRSPYVALGRLIDGRCAGDDFPVDAPLDGASHGRADPAAPASRVLRTGDLVRLREDGLIDLVGRKDRQIKIRGQRVEPGEVEAAILRWADVADTAVIGRHEADLTSLIAYVAPRQAASARLLAELNAHLREVLPPSLRPRAIYRIAAIPRLPVGKVDLAALRAMDADIAQHEAAASRAAPVPVPEAMAGGDIQAKVAAIWQQVLKRHEIGPHANFFDLGGDSLSVIQLMFEIEQALGVELPVAMIYRAPTLASLTAAIQAHETISFSPLVLVKPGGDAPPLFIVHGVGGNVMELFTLCRNMDHRGPVYAVQSRGLDGREAPNRTVAAMVEDYWSAIRAVQDRGPYYLAGYSFGGSVAFELACRIKATGEEVAFLGLLDTATNARQWPRHVWLKWLGGRAWRHVRTVQGLPAHERRQYLRRITASFRASMRWRLGLASVQESKILMPAGIPKAFAEVRLANLSASAAYRPGFYPGVLTLVSSKLGDTTMCDPVDIWRHRARVVAVHQAPGSHMNMVEGDHGIEVARILGGAIRDATEAKS